MNSEERERLAERWLDAGLKHYAAVEPPEGLEARVLKALESKPAVRRFVLPWSRSLAWRVVAAAVIVGVVFLVGSLYRGTQTPTKPVRVTGVVQTSVKPVVREEAVVKRDKQVKVDRDHRDVRRTIGNKSPSIVGKSELAAQIPKREQFPSAMPLTEEERLMTSYLRETPRDEVLLAVARREAERKEAQKRFDSEPAPE